MCVSSVAHGLIHTSLRASRRFRALCLRESVGELSLFARGALWHWWVAALAGSLNDKFTLWARIHCRADTVTVVGCRYLGVLFAWDAGGFGVANGIACRCGCDGSVGVNPITFAFSANIRRLAFRVGGFSACLRHKLPAPAGAFSAP